MDSGRNGGNVIYIIDEDEVSCHDKLLPPEEFEYPDTSFDANPNTIDEEDAFRIENDRSHKSRFCKKFIAEGSCPFGDGCVYFHDEERRSRESTAIVLVSEYNAGYGNGVTGSGGSAAAPPLAPLPSRPPAVPLARAEINDTSKPMNWRTRICKRWEQAGHCQFGSKCFFAHGEAELQQYGGGPDDNESNPNNQGQGVTFPNVVSATRSSLARVVTASGSSVTRAGSSEQLPGAVRRRASKWPTGINLIYGDWIDDIE